MCFTFFLQILNLQWLIFANPLQFFWLTPRLTWIKAIYQTLNGQSPSSMTILLMIFPPVLKLLPMESQPLDIMWLVKQLRLPILPQIVLETMSLVQWRSLFKVPSILCNFYGHTWYLFFLSFQSIIVCYLLIQSMATKTVLRLKMLFTVHLLAKMDLHLLSRTWKITFAQHRFVCLILILLTGNPFYNVAMSRHPWVLLLEAQYVTTLLTLYSPSMWETYICTCDVFEESVM